VENKQRVTLFKLFATSFVISLFTIGSGIVSLPLYKRKLVEEYRWLDELEMSEVMTIAQCSPGAVVVNMAVCLGFRLKGIVGVLAMVLGTLLPPLVLMVLVQDVYRQFSQDPLIIALFRGMNAAVSAVLIGVVVSMIKEIEENKILTYLLVILAFGLVYYIKLSPVWIMLGGIVLALSVSLRRSS